MQPQFFSITIDWYKVRTRWSNKLLKRGFIILGGDRQLCFRGLPKSIRVDRRQKSWRIIQQRGFFLMKLSVTMHENDDSLTVAFIKNIFSCQLIDNIDVNWSSSVEATNEVCFHFFLTAQ